MINDAGKLMSLSVRMGVRRLPILCLHSHSGRSWAWCGTLIIKDHLAPGKAKSSASGLRPETLASWTAGLAAGPEEEQAKGIPDLGQILAHEGEIATLKEQLFHLQRMTILTIYIYQIGSLASR